MTSFTAPCYLENTSRGREANEKVITPQNVTLTNNIDNMCKGITQYIIDIRT